MREWVRLAAGPNDADGPRMQDRLFFAPSVLSQSYRAEQLRLGIDSAGRRYNVVRDAAGSKSYLFIFCLSFTIRIETANV